MTQSNSDTTQRLRFCLVPLKESTDKRGSLCVIDPSDGQFPFEVKRVFWITGVPEGEVRGDHAHRSCSEVIVPLRGSFVAHVNDGRETADFLMDDHRQGLFIPPMVWCSFSDFSADCLCLCLASEGYGPEGYIDSLEDYLKEVRP